MLLSKRLQIVLALLDQTDILADVGCDHGYLACQALVKGLNFVQVIDNKKGPLKKAQENLITYPSTLYEISLSDGISQINDRINTLTICGMGGELILAILKKNPEVARRMKKIIVQANTKINVLRKGLSVEGFQIIEEKIVKDHGKFYEVILVKFNPQNSILSESQQMFGPILMVKKEELFIEKWTQIKNKIIKILDNNPDIIELKKQLDMIEAIIK